MRMVKVMQTKVITKDGAVEVAHEREWLDYSTISTFLRCPRRFMWQYIFHLRPSEANEAMTFGSAVHAAIATYRRYILRQDFDGIKRGDAIQEAFKVGSDILKDGGVSGNDPRYTLTSLAEVVSEYLERWSEDYYIPLEIEVPFVVDFGDFVYCGSIDEIAEGTGFIRGLMVKEIKTTGIVNDKWQERVKPNLQIDGYVAAVYAMTGTIPNAFVDVIYTAKKRKPSQRYTTTRTIDDILSWEENIFNIHEDIKRCYERWFFPKNTEMCVPLIGYSCSYRDLCMRHPSVKSTKLEDYDPSGYIIEEWHPLEKYKREESNAIVSNDAK